MFLFDRFCLKKRPKGVFELGDRVSAKWGDEWFTGHVIRRFKGRVVRVLWDVDGTYSEVSIDDVVKI